MADTASYLVYPPGVEQYLTLPWGEVRGLLADPFASFNVNVDKENLAQSVRSGIITSTGFDVLDGDRGGGLIVLERAVSTLQSAALCSVADTLKPEPMGAMWNMVGRPDLPQVALVEPRSDYRLLLKAAGQPVPNQRFRNVAFTLEYAETDHVFRAYFLGTRINAPEVLSSLVEGAATLFVDTRRVCHIGTDPLDDRERQAVVSRFRPRAPQVVVLTCEIGRDAHARDVAAVLYLAHWLAGQRGVRVEVCHMFGRFPGKPSFLPRMRSRKLDRPARPS